MEPTENSISEGASDTKEVGRGDFSLKPAGRRNGNGKLLFFAIGGGVLLVIVLAVLFGWAVISSMDKADPVIDESSVKPAAVLQQDTGKDDSMAAQMDKILNKPAQEVKPAETETAAATAASQKTEETASTQQRQGHATEGSDSGAGSNQSPYAQPQQQEEEQLFAKINRFESTGMSAGSGGGSAAYGGSAGNGDSGGGGDEARMRQFINADPNELARNLAKSAGGSSSGSDGLGGGSGGSLLDNLGGGSQYATARATLAPEQKFLLRRRSTFQCVLDTGIRTDYPGFVECHLLQPLYSSDGSVILARAGAIFYGEQKIEVKAGQSSVFTTWTDMETSTGQPGERPVRAALNGLGTDPMGRSGTDAEVDNHWGKRAGGAVLLSTFKDLLKGGMNAVSKNNSNQFSFNNTENSSEDLASKMLDNTIGIPPTAFVNPGTVINIVVAQDIDFSSVFKTRRIN